MKWSRSQVMECPITTHAFFILICIFCLISVTLGQRSNETCGSFTMAPGMTRPQGDIILREGQDLDIYCILNDGFMNENHVNSSHLVFYHDSNLLPAEMVEIVNSSTIRLHVENVTRSFSNYYCQFKNGTAVCYNKVVVDTIPRKVEPNDFRCFSSNWQNLTCKWRVPKHYVKTEYKLQFMLPGRAARFAYNCPKNESKLIGNDKKEYQCFWSLGTDPIYRQGYPVLKFILQSKNIFGTTNSTFDFNHYAHVIPSRAEGLNITSVTTHSAILAWNSNVALFNFPPGIIYQLEIQSEFDEPSDWKKIEFDNKQLKNITVAFDKYKYIYPINNLPYPYTIYDIQLRSRSREARSEWCWSEYAKFSFTTLSDHPSQPPKTDIGSFELNENVNNNYRDVYIYWQQIERYQQNGPNFNYTIIVRENHMIQNIKPNYLELSYAKFNSLGPQEYLFEILSTNAVGNSNYSSFVRVPSLKNVIPEPLSFTKIVYDFNKYELSWIAPKTNHRITSYTVFWCKNLKDWPFQCTGYLNWTRVNSNVTIWNVTMPDDGIYQFAIAANTESSSSGMVWASCTVIHNKFQGKMKNLHTETKGPKVIEVNWKLDCSGRIGIVTGFRIYYCPVLKRENSECIQPEKNLTVPGDLSTIIGNLTNLTPFTLYRIHVAVITRNAHGLYDEGPKSDPKFSETSETSPDKPRNANIVDVSNTTVTIIWNPPTTINGILRYFQIEYRSALNMSDAGKIRVRYQGTHSNVSAQQNITAILTGLRSFTRYNIQLSACTILCSDLIYLNKTTSFGVPDKMHKLTTTYLNDTIVFEWIPPATPGGPNFYQLKSEYKKDGIIHRRMYNTTENAFRVTDRQICESDSRITFMWRIRAIVLVDNNTGDRLEGPWSDSIEVPCTPPQSSSFLKYCILIILIFMVLCLSTFYGNKFWIHCKDMRDVEVKLPPGLTTTSSGVVGDTTHWNPPGSLCMPQHKIPKDRPITDTTHHLPHHIIAADEQLLLEKKREFDSELTDLSVNPSITMNLSNSETGSVCNSSNESEISSSTPITNLNLSIDNNSSTSDKDNCSLRLRNVQLKPTSIAETQNPTPWNKGYVTLPTPDKNDQFVSGPWSKAMQLKTLDGYSQIGVEAKQMQTPPTVGQVVGSGYVPHTAMVPSNNAPPQPMSIIKATPQAPDNIASTGAYLLPKLVDKTNGEHDRDDDDNDDDEDDDDYNLSEQDSPLVDLEPSSGEFSSIETDDLINIDESGVMIYADADDKQPPTVTESNKPYVSLATAMSRTSSQRDQSKLPTTVDNTQQGGPGGPVAPTQPSSTANKPTTPNPYSRIGIWDNTPSSVAAWTPPTPSGDVNTIGVENKEFVLPQPSSDGTLDKTQPTTSTTVGGDNRTTKSSGYVPHRQFDCKLFKED